MADSPFALCSDADLLSFMSRGFLEFRIATTTSICTIDSLPGPAVPASTSPSSVPFFCTDLPPRGSGFDDFTWFQTAGGARLLYGESELSQRISFSSPVLCLSLVLRSPYTGADRSDAFAQVRFDPRNSFLSHPFLSADSMAATGVNTAAADGGLKSCWDDAKVHADLQTYLTGKGVESLSDFIRMVKADDYEDELLPFVQACPATKDNLVQLARLRAAWVAGNAAIKKLSENADGHGDIEAPLPDPTLRELNEAWTRTYNMSLSIRLDPTDPLISRLYREYRRVTPSVIPVEKAKAVYSKHKPAPEKDYVDVGPKVRLEIDPRADASVRSVTDYYWCLRIMANACAKAGNYDVPSRIEPGTTVRFAPFGINLTYADETFRLTLAARMSASDAVSWYREKDTLTRGYMVSHMRAGYSQGEALVKALEENRVEWKLFDERDRSRSPPQRDTPQKRQKSFRDDDSSEDKPRKKKSRNPPRSAKGSDKQDNAKPVLRLATTMTGNRRLCRAFNTTGCARIEKNCPHKQAHRCDAILPNGKPCWKPHPRCQG